MVTSNWKEPLCDVRCAVHTLPGSLRLPRLCSPLSPQKSFVARACFEFSGILLQRLEMRVKPNLRDQCWDDRASDDGRQEYRILILIDDVVRQSE